MLLRVVISRSWKRSLKTPWKQCWQALFFLQISDNTGYKGHILCVEAFDRAMQCKEVYPNPRKDMKILDAGAGTGGIGELLKARGYTNVDALDISQEMLDLAAPKNLYKKLICAPLTDTYMKEVETAEYDVVLCGGTIVYGQAKPGAIEQCARFVKPGKWSSNYKQELRAPH